jgi:hypothetical protein
MPTRARALPGAAVDAVVAKPPLPTKDARQQAAALLGRLGGLKGGKARTKKLSASRRRTIAQKAARARWSRS